MTNELRTLLGTQTYSHADVAYHIGVLKEFLEYVFFTAHKSHSYPDVVTSFIQQHEQGSSELAFLGRLPETFFNEFSQESLYIKLERLADEAKNLPTLSLVVPVVLDSKQIVKIGIWARTEIRDDVLLDIDVNPNISVGCQIIWHDMLYDFGLDRQLTKHRLEIADAVQRAMPAFTESK